MMNGDNSSVSSNSNNNNNNSNDNDNNNSNNKNSNNDEKDSTNPTAVPVSYYDTSLSSSQSLNTPASSSSASFSFSSTPINEGFNSSASTLLSGANNGEGNSACDSEDSSNMEERLEELRKFVAPLSKELLIDLIASAALSYEDVYVKCTQAVASSPSARRLMIRNISFATKDESFINLFSQLGEIEDAVIVREKDGKSKGYGFVTFKYLENVRRCLNTPHTLEGKELHVKLASDPFTDCEQRKLFIRNLADSTDTEKLKQIFAQFGEIEECVVVSDSSGKSKNYGFVTFSHHSSAFKAVQQSERIIDGRIAFIHFATPPNNKGKNAGTGGASGGAKGANSGNYRQHNYGSSYPHGGYSNTKDNNSNNSPGGEGGRDNNSNSNYRRSTVAGGGPYSSTNNEGYFHPPPTSSSLSHHSRHRTGNNSNNNTNNRHSFPPPHHAHVGHPAHHTHLTAHSHHHNAHTHSSSPPLPYGYPPPSYPPPYPHAGAIFPPVPQPYSLAYPANLPPSNNFYQNSTCMRY